MNKPSVEHIEQSIQNAIAGKSNLTEDILAIRGFSTPTIRHLFNNICNIHGAYLEVGLFCGASYVSSFNEQCISVGVEDHSQDFSAGFDQVKKELMDNVKKNQDRAGGLHVHYVDCFKMDKSVLPKIDIYFFDGFHSKETQAKALPYFLDKMADRFLFMVDDYSWPYVKEGTWAGLNELKDKINIEKGWVLGEGCNNDPVWHNSIALFLINKKDNDY